MLKKRVVACLVMKDGIIVQSVNFKKYLPVGKPAVAIEFLNHWGIDEIVILDISASAKQAGPAFEVIRDSTTKCYVPLTVGGGICSVGHIQELMHCGADKISLNQAALHNPELISAAAQMFGNQCVVVSIDALKDAKGDYQVYDHLEKKVLDIRPSDFAKRCEKLGAGEIFLTSIDRDGSYQGYDLELIGQVCGSVTIPVICSGGARTADDFIEVFEKTTVSAAAAANMFHFTEHSVNLTKAIIKKEMNIRLETHANYKDADFDSGKRLKKKPDHVLEEMLFVKIEKEVI